MLDVGFSELLLIAVAAIIFIRPKDMPVIIRHATKFIREIKSLTASVRAQMREVVEASGIEEISRMTTTIIDLEGKKQRAYDVAELGALKAPSIIEGDKSHE